MSQLFASSGQSIGVSALASFLPMNTQDWTPLEKTGWMLQSKGFSTVFSNTTVQKHQFFDSSFFTVQLSHPYMTTGKTIALTRWTFVGKVMSLFLNMLSRLVINFLVHRLAFNTFWWFPLLSKSFKLNYIPFVYFCFYFHLGNWLKILLQFISGFCLCFPLWILWLWVLHLCL